VPQFHPFDFTVVPSDIIVLPGQEALLACSARYNSNPPSVYSWERNGELLPIWSPNKER